MKVVILLLQEGAEVNAKSMEYEEQMEGALEMGRTDIVESLLQAGAKAKVQVEGNGEELQSELAHRPLDVAVD
jgi:hypothetical protein